MTASTTREQVDMELRAGLARLREHWLNQAELSFRHVLAIEPDQPSALHWLGITLSKLKRHQEGCALIRRAAELRPESETAWRDLAVALRNSGQAEQAADAYARAISNAAAGPSSRTVPPLESQAFSVEDGKYPFKLVDYSYQAGIRYGATNPPHTELAERFGAGQERYTDFVRELGEMRDQFEAIPVRGDYGSTEPFWLNTWFPPLDAMALQGFLRKLNPRLFVEIGSGMSTKFARRAVDAHQLRTQIVSIDPQPRNIIDQICHQVIRAPLESCPPSLFDKLENDDILFLDSSHRCFQNSDVTVFFLEILPRLKPGVVVHIHDVYLPFDYPAGHLRRLWNEQYLLATALLFGGGALQVLMPCWYVSQDAGMASYTDQLLRQGALKDLSIHGASIWLRKV